MAAVSLGSASLMISVSGAVPSLRRIALPIFRARVEYMVMPASRSTDDRDRADCHRHRSHAGACSIAPRQPRYPSPSRSEEHTSELQSLMRHSYAVFCLKQKKTTPKQLK